jgi:tetratricopeptide (TPR) repeat protein
MSLLLEALKKAEQAKQSGAAQDPESTLHGGEGLSLAPEKPASGEGAERAPITRDRLPEINQTLEILTDDLPSAAAGAAGRDVPPSAPSVGTERSGAGTARIPTRSAAQMRESRDDFEQQQAERDAARQLFEAKPAEYDPRRPFKITLAALCVAAIGIAVYFWWQTQPRGLQVAQRAPEAPATQIAPAPPAASTAQPSAPASTSPAVSPVEPATAPPATGPAPSAAPQGSVPVPPQPMASPRPSPFISQPPGEAPAVKVRPSTKPRAVTPPPAASPARPGAGISVTRSATTINSALAAGYAAFQSGDLAAARREYERALAADRRNRDALLGLAAVDIRSGDYGSAEEYYLRVLEIDPRDPDANAGMVSLRGRADPVQSESRLKTLIAAQSDSAPLHFALGNQLAVQSRWAEAQAAYFRAASIEPENPDYAFNLAVSLDQMRQARPALEHYQRALALAGSRVASFNKPQVENRIRELQR